MLAGGTGAVFKGIPFAQPPVGELRWREPLPVKAWSGVRDAEESAAPCAQASYGWNEKFAAAGKEDCLYVDVWTPAWPPTSRKAVMVWIHGGANNGGAGGFDPLYAGSELIRHDVVLVLLQYRVGIFSTFADPELTRESAHHSSGNYGLLDQIAALHWVHDNIAKFGGDPENVTIFGQSAGSMDALYLMSSPLAKGLFHRVIAESGPVLTTEKQRPLAAAEADGARLAERLSAPVTSRLAHLRSLSTTELLGVREDRAGFNEDSWVFSAPPTEVFAAGKEYKVPLMIGTVAIEFPAEGSREDLKKRVETRNGENAAKALKLYGLDGPEGKEINDPVYGNLGEQVGTDEMRCSAAVQGEWHNEAGNAAWEYEFDRAIPPRPKTGHSTDLPYVFGNLYAEGSQAGNFQEADRKLSETIQGYWTNFAKTGNPNGTGLLEWPKYDGSTRKFMKFGSDGGVMVKENQRGAYCELVRERLGKYKQNR